MERKDARIPAENVVKFTAYHRSSGKLMFSQVFVCSFYLSNPPPIPYVSLPQKLPKAGGTHPTGIHSCSLLALIRNWTVQSDRHIRFKINSQQPQPYVKKQA